MHPFTASFILYLFALPAAQARPTEDPFISLSLHRVSSSQTTSHLPPTIVHQQHANRGIRRLDIMSGSSATPDTQLLANLQKRFSVLSPSLREQYNNAKSISLTSRFQNASGSHYIKNNVTIPLAIESHDIGYYAPLQIGTPRRKFNILMDSGSADFWVGSTNCSTNGGSCGNHVFLGPVESSTFNTTDIRWETKYGSGAVRGNLAYDDVTIAGLMLRSYQFGVATFESNEFVTAPFDGLAGLAKSKLSRQHTVPLVEACQQQGLIKHAIVSYKIPRFSDNKHDGEMTLGGLNPARYDPKTIVTVPNINQHGFWEAKIDAIFVNHKNMGWKNRTSIFDTGTTLLIAPQEDVNAIHQEIPGAKFDGQAWTIPCKVNASFSLVIDGRQFFVDARDLAFSPVDPDRPTGTCTSGFSGKTNGLGTQWLVGDVFLKNVYMSTNVDMDEISFAKLAGHI